MLELGAMHKFNPEATRISPNVSANRTTLNDFLVLLFMFFHYFNCIIENFGF